MSLNIEALSKALLLLLPPSILENILFYAGDVFLYFDYTNKLDERLRTLITYNDGPGFVLQEAIKYGHKPVIQWLLEHVNYPKDYLLVSAVCYGDLFTLVHIISLIGEGYMEYDTEAKLLSIMEGKMYFLEYLYNRNKTFACDSSYLRLCIISGMYNSSEICAWYTKNKPNCPQIPKEILIEAYLGNGDILQAKKLLGKRNIPTLLKSLSLIYSGKEETYQWLIATYSDEERVLMYVAKACARMGYVETLEVLLNEPYNVHVEYDMFVGISSLEVAKTLHKYAYQRDCISKMLNQGCIRKMKSRFSTYRDPKTYLQVLQTFINSDRISKPLDAFIQSDRGFVRISESIFMNKQSECVLLFLVDLAQITTNSKHVKKYIEYAIQFGLPGLLRKLLPYLRETDRRSLLNADMYRSYNERMIDCLLEAGITHVTSLDLLISNVSFKCIQNFIQNDLILKDGNLLEWNPETEKAIQIEMLINILTYTSPPHLLSKDTQIALIRQLSAEIYNGQYFQEIVETDHTVSLSTDHVIPKWQIPSLPRMLSVEDTITAEVEYHLQAINMHLLLKALNNDIYLN
ncbi:hypothetical protein K7432_014311 [Basidiobolus ranarum]|uniref:Ankyrin repeat-containing protein n=1 Tax=Basidiobolus ranarum TaxID=34480 RepID=A0ABR2WI00_9FUNG